MSDTPRKEQVEQQNERVEQSPDKINDLPEKAITDQDAEAVKGGYLAKHSDDGPTE
jgi:hypothetical protein